AQGHFDILFKGTPAGTVRWTLTGRHNRMNALAAIAAAEHVGVSAACAIDALSLFAGVKRRMEVRASIEGIVVYDDFAHHPTAIETTLAGLRDQVGSARIIAVLEPRSNTMKLGAMAARLPHALAWADRVFCFGAEDGKHALGWAPAAVLAPLGERVSVSSDIDALTQAIASEAQPGDHIVIMSNGAFGGIHDKLVAALRDSHPGAAAATPGASRAPVQAGAS
ncbi:MAG: hypothetical protein EOO27_31980, partial [Comamonadaceae bacterium]